MNVQIDRLNQIRRKLDQLLTYDIEEYASLSLGITKHKFRLEPPLKEEEVLAFEEQWGISLPPDYRAFITSVGSSGAGPYYGLLPLSQATLHLNCDDDATYKKVLGALFPLSDKIYQYKKYDDWLVEVGGENWHERRFTPESWDPYQGTIAICHQGCTYFTVLVLNGPYRGAIWNIDEAHEPPVKSTYSGFLDYYEGWVDLMLAKEEELWYGYPRTETLKKQNPNDNQSGN